MHPFGWVNSANLAGGLTRYVILGSNIVYQTNPTWPIYPSARGILKNLRVDVSVNTLVGTCTVTLLVWGSLLFASAGTSTLLTITIPAGTTGLFPKDANEVAVGPEVPLFVKVVTGAGAGGIMIDSISVFFADPWTCAHRPDLV